MVVDLVGKCLFASMSIASSCCTIYYFGWSVWPLLFIGIGVLVLLSLRFGGLRQLASLLAKISALLALLGLILLLLAAMTGGSFHLSPSNIVLAILMGGMVFTGLSAFFWSLPIEPDPQSTGKDHA